MNKRMDKFFSYSSHPMLDKQFNKLKASDVAFIYNFLSKNVNDSKDEVEFKINRLFLDKDNKPKNWQVIAELLSCCNTL